MNAKFIIYLLISFALVFSVAACSPAATESEEPSGETPAATEEAAPTGEIVIDTADACDLFSKEQVEAAFGKSTTEVNSQSEVIGVECEYVFDAETDTQLRVTFYDGDAAKNYFASLIAASNESCDAFFEAFFDLALGQGADTGQNLESTVLADLYRQYLVALEPCMYAHSEDRSAVATNVVASEVIFLNWSSNVAVLADNRVVELTYQEPVSAEAEAEFDTAMDRDSLYALAQPYRDSVLVGYTEILIGLLQAVVVE